MKEILSHLLADAEARSLVSDSFPKMHINNKMNVSVKAVCRVAAKKLLNKALQILREHAGSLLQAARLVQSMELTDKNDFGDSCHMASTSLSFMILHTSLSKKSMRCQQIPMGDVSQQRMCAHPMKFQDIQLKSLP